MKWMICLILVWCVTGGIELFDGLGENIEILRNPFFNVIDCPVDFLILSPTNQTYYNNNVDINLSVSSGSCFYRVIQGENTFGWNAISCDDNTKTLPDGYQTIEVMVTDNGCSYSKFKSFTVWIPRPSAGGGLRQSGWYPLLFLAAVILLKKCRRKRKDCKK